MLLARGMRARTLSLCVEIGKLRGYGSSLGEDDKARLLQLLYLLKAWQERLTWKLLRGVIDKKEAVAKYEHGIGPLEWAC
ncbi:MAG: hypothetical protein LBR78_00160 [Holosporales bacterium]|jgi:hypothetical protein|nr:hypothetical protein [Holosporales bacterium]